jgi:hypothetical protein
MKSKISFGRSSSGDVVDSEDIDIYRQLAGGVTAACNYSSADCIGGQSSLIKFRWDKLEGLKIQDADGFEICWAKTVKRPFYAKPLSGSRMGVEQDYQRCVLAGKAYENSWKEYATDCVTKWRYTEKRHRIGYCSPRNSERRTLYHVPLLHSVRNKYADEVADDMGFRVKYIYTFWKVTKLLTK